jgi:hypothetical protein
MGKTCSTYGERRGANSREGDHSEDPGIDGKIILKWILEKWNVGAWTGSICLRRGTGGGALVNAVMNLRVP